MQRQRQKKQTESFLKGKLLPPNQQCLERECGDGPDTVYSTIKAENKIINSMKYRTEI